MEESSLMYDKDFVSFKSCDIQVDLFLFLNLFFRKWSEDFGAMCKGAFVVICPIETLINEWQVTQLHNILISYYVSFQVFFCRTFL